MDILSRSARSVRMGLIRSRDTKPEMAVRRLVYGLGYRFRLHGKNLPGRPDLVFRSRLKVIFVHGCFWHMHRNCGRQPKSRLTYWKPKLQRNAERDKIVRRELNRNGWRSLVIWECQIGRTVVERRIRRFLDKD
ncbi:MAG: DNA mismatch endonuclease Vsr [Candidatus Sulfotelmatobacter sp.]